MGKQLVKIGKSLKDQDAYDEDLVIKGLCLIPKKDTTTRMGGTRQIRKTVNVKDSKSAKQVNPDMVERLDEAGGLPLAAKYETGKRMEVKEDNITEEEVKRIEAFINMIIACILVLALISGIKSASLDMAAKFSTKYLSSSSPRRFDAKSFALEPKQPLDDLTIPMNEQEKCTDYKPKISQVAGSAIPSKQEVKEDLVKSEKKGNLTTEEAFILLIIGCLGFFLMLSDIAATFSNYSSSSPRIDAPLPVSFPMRIAVSPRKDHQVFLNFRGKQLRYNFISHLSDAFQRHKIKFFIDKNEQRGKDLKDLFVRIEDSSIALAIFSTRYTESSWCMDELVKMKKLADQGKLRVIPIFYKVDAEDVRKPTSCSEFGKNFWRLAESSSGDQIKQWKEALECICDKMGLSYGDNCSESDFVKEIVKEVQRVIESIGLRKKRNHFWSLAPP